MAAAAALAATDAAKEQRWADQLVDGLVVGEPVWLESEGHKFLAIHTPAATARPRGAVILLHGMGVHPDWPEVIHPLRVELPEAGWTTLSVQMPILANDAPAADYAPLIDEAAARIAAAIAFLRGRGEQPVIVLGHSLGATMAAAFAAARPDAGVDGLVLIGMSAGQADSAFDNLARLDKIAVPLLDLYGSRDLDAVRDSAAARRLAARRAGNEDYRQLSIEGADHFFVGLEDTLVARVRAWLYAHFASDTTTGDGSPGPATTEETR